MYSAQCACPAFGDVLNKVGTGLLLSSNGNCPLTQNPLVRDYAEDLKNLLADSSITEQRGFLRSLVEKIEVGDAEVKMYYTIPVPPIAPRQEAVGVVLIVHYG